MAGLRLLNLTRESQLSWLRVVILSGIGILAFLSRLFSVIRFESIIHEFDPWFNYRATQKLTESGFYDFWNWFDSSSWYPLGRVVGGTVYPGIMVTAGIIHRILNALHFPVHIREVCVFLAPAFSALTAVAAYLLAGEMKDSSAGLLAAAFIGIAPGYISRSVAGSYDNEAIAIFLLVFVFYLWIRALKLGSAFWGSLCGLFYFYMVSAWGGYAFITNLIPLHVLALMAMGRFSSRCYVAYSSWYALGTLASMQIPFVGFQPVRTSEHMAALGIFGLCQIMAFTQFLRSLLPARTFQVLLQAAALLAFGGGLAALILLTTSGFIAPWTGRFYSLWDTGYAKKYIPIIASVSEHQPTAWPSFMFDLGFLIPIFPAGIFMCFQELRDEHVFVILYAVTASYFAGVMVRLMLTLTPIVCVASALAVSKLLDVYLKDSNANEAEGDPSSTNGDNAATQPAEDDPVGLISKMLGIPRHYVRSVVNTRWLVVGSIAWIMVMFAWHCTWVTSNAYSSPSVVLASRGPDGSQHLIDDFREAYYWLWQNTPEDAKVMSWWDYGYQIAGMANRTTLVDNNTWNNTHIATVGKAMSSPEDKSYDIMVKHDVDYVLIIFGGLIGYSGDDINKFLWMIRIAEGIWPNEVIERNFFTERGEYRVDDEATPTMKNSLMYKMSYYRFQDLYGGQQAIDRVRGTPIQSSKVKLTVVEEAFTSENFIVRIYKVKKPDELGRSLESAQTFDEGKRRRKTAQNKSGKRSRKSRAGSKKQSE
ncbi:glycosyltransferase family 66 protein [Gonapodya prolifera JEL478]|uniref:Dolichyl-diphosphooligosaccharide--protein glycosyltransferase subunit STT3 n=1 Tax=Gonapodya prolifera (strain JEL478) TaxID=1344416 RepID=A0A139A000_GONPJ|nr:glycosyltransferase family 66 protein [Gonapodya prolifera JEL478]|eukprot:KXS10091.1 glycosyltransferase family 66 protein [Gonapodya prolifera JEL478]